MFFPELFISGYMFVALNTPSIFPLRNISMSEPSLLAKAALVINTKNDRALLDKGANQLLPMASLTKLLSALVALDTVSLDKIITLDKNAIDTFGEAGDFKAGERVEARHLLFASLIASSNDALSALVSDVGTENFLSLIRSKVIGLNLKKTIITDPVGLSPRTISSPFEVAKIARAAFMNDFLSQILAIPEYSFKSASGIPHKLVSTNELIFDPRILAAKTGYLKEVGENYAALVKEGDEKLIVIIMGSSNRAKDMLTILNWLDKGFVWK